MTPADLSEVLASAVVALREAQAASWDADAAHYAERGHAAAERIAREQAAWYRAEIARIQREREDAIVAAAAGVRL